MSTTSAQSATAGVLGVKVSPVNMEMALARADALIGKGAPAYVCLSSVHGVMEAQRDPEFLRILNGAAMNLPDGMPLTWVGHAQGFTAMDRVFGPDFMLEFCRYSVSRGYRHFLYGGAPGVAEELQAALRVKAPGVEIVGTFTPPFRPLSEAEEFALAQQVRACQPDVLWVGLSTPKQERWMSHYVRRLGVPLMVGVGAAFDYHTGRVRDCQPWIKRAGMQWFHRLLQDPKRLGKRYLGTHPRFAWQILWEIGSGKLRPATSARTHSADNRLTLP